MSNKEFNSWAIKQTEKAGWGESKFHLFMSRATQHEFAQSQVPFFYAVEAFPRMLCALVSKIEDSTTRLLVVENIFEEHGRGQSEHFHTETYQTYLQAIGFKDKLFKNPWVTEWVNTVLSNTMSASENAAYLSGIEYLYALICQDISAHVSGLTLNCEQTHYAKHAELDWEHGYELLSVGITIEKDLTKEMKKAFKKAQKDFLYMYEHLMIPTRLDMKEISEEKIAFYYIREDSEVELSALNSLNGSCLDVLSITSGGEHIFEYLTHARPLNIHAIDINPYQIELAKRKLNDLLSEPSDYFFAEQEIGKFEKMFSLMRSFFTIEEIEDIQNNISTGIDKLKFIVTVLFSNEYLNIVFTDSATKYTKKSFAKHFTEVFISGLQSGERNALNIFLNKPVRDYVALSNNIQDSIHKHSIMWEVINPMDMNSQRKYDMINLSNIGDWMELKDYEAIIKKFRKNNLNRGGCIIARKLLGDYKLKSLFEKCGFDCIIVEDSTQFYSEVVIAYRK